MSADLEMWPVFGVLIGLMCAPLILKGLWRLSQDLERRTLQGTGWFSHAYREQKRLDDIAANRENRRINADRPSRSTEP